MFGESAHGVEAASRLLKKSIRGLFDSDHPWSSPYGRYYVAPNFSPGEIVNTQSKKRPLLRIPALAAFVHPAQHGFCFASFSKHVKCLKMAVRPCTATGRKPKCRERRDARERPPQG